MQNYSGGICLVVFLAGMFVLTPAPQIKHAMSEFDNWIVIKWWIDRPEMQKCNCPIQTKQDNYTFSFRADRSTTLSPNIFPFPYIPNPPGFDARDYTFENVKFKLYAGTYNNLCYFTDWEHGTAEGNELAAPNGFHVYRKVPWSESTCTKPDGWRMTDQVDEETTNDEGATTSHMSATGDDREIGTEYSTTEAPPMTVTTSEMTETVTSQAGPAQPDLPTQFVRLVKCFKDDFWLIALETEEVCADRKFERYNLDVCVATNEGQCLLTDYYISNSRFDISKRPSAHKFLVAAEKKSCGATLQLHSQTVVDDDGMRSYNYTSEEIDGYNPTGFWVWEAKHCDA